DRPADAAVEVVLTLDSTGTATLTQGAFESWHQNLEIIGDQDIMFTGAVGLGEPLGVPTNPFDIDFSALEGNVINFTVDNFELLGQGGSITGNADAGYASEVHISIAADEGVSGTAAATAPANSVGFDEPDAGSLHSSGVTRYVVTTIDGPTANGSTGNQATIKLCDTAQDIEVFALRGNYNDTLVVQDAAWGLVFELQGGGTAKAEGPTGSSNVGALVANYEWEHADAVVNLVHSVAGDVRPLHAAGITIDNADSITINGDGTAVTIEDVNGDDVTSLDVNNAGNVTIVDALPEDLLVIDAAGVTGTFSAVVDPADDFSFVGAAGGSTLTFEEDSSFTADDGSMDATVTTIDGGAAGVVLTVGEDSDINLEEATLINVTQVVLGDDAELSLTMAQADEIGAANFVLALGADNATLNLSGLDGEPFALANYAAGIDVGLVTIADLPVVTLHPDTDLTGIGGLLVPEGTVLNLTAAQFQQLGGWAFTGPEGWGSIAGIGGTTDFTVNITDLTQVDVDNDLNGDGDSNDNGFPNFENLNLSQVTADTKTITLAESVTLDASDNLGGFEVIMGDDMTLALADIQQADGLVIGGGSNTTLQFNDTSAGPFESIDASGFSVDTLMILNVLVANRNVDLMFFGLQESVTKVIYNGLGWVDGVTQNVVLVEGTTVDGWVVFNKPEADVEIRDFNLTMEGGTEITGNLRLSASSNEAGLQQMDLQSVTINSNATADDVATDDVVEGTNRYTGETTNIIGGDITSQGTGWQGTYNSVDNDLLNVTINAEQDFILEGDIIFESVTGNDAVTANDDEEATAVLNVNGPADVTIEGDLDTSDSDVDALVVNHAGTGTMDIRLDGWDIDPTDTITINGDAVGVDVVRISDSIDLSVNGSSISNIDQILLENGSNLTLTFDQYEALGSIVDLAVVGDTATISIVGLDNGDVFDATLLPAGITVASITMAAGNVTIDPASDLTGVGQIIVPEGGTLNLTAAQFNQLAGTGSIVGLDVNGDLTIGEYFVNITDLMQSDIANDLNGDGDSADAGEAFDISGIVGATTTLALGEPQVNLALDTVLGSLTALEVLLADGETLGLASEVQADGLVVTGGVNSTLIFQFAPHTTFPGQIDASGYDVTTLKALASGFTIGGNSNVEYSIDDLASSVELRLYADPADLGFLDPTYRVVVIEAGITTPTGLIFNDWDAGDEVRSLTLTLEGDVELNGNLSIPTRTDKVGTLVQQYFDILTINSVGTLPNLIDGNVNTVTVLGAPNTSDNNLLNVAIDATQDLVIDGDIVFNSVDVPDDDAVATLTITGSANVTIQQLVAIDVDIDTLNVANDGTGVLTVTGASAAIEGGSIETLTLSGTGDIVLGTNPDVVSEWGITAPTLSVLDASGLSGDLSLGEVKDIDSAAFTFTSGTGVTTMTLTTDDLDSTNGTPLITTDDTIGWNFDFSGAAAGSEFHLGALGTLTPGSILNIDLGANTTLYIDASMDLSDLDLSILQTLDIVLADGATLTLNAAQADDLNIVAGADTGLPGFTGVVNIVDLGDTPVDLSGIAAGIAGDVTLEDNDVTLDVATDLGFFTVALTDIANADSLAGQTIRFQTVAQAERDIRVGSEFYGQDTDGTANHLDTTSSTNVVWLFNNITAPVDTSGYDAEIGRLWLTDDLITNEGGLVESLFTTLPSTILRVDFADLTALNILLASNTVNRTVEFVNFTALGSLTFSDVGATPEEHIQNLTLKLGGEVTMGNILVDDVVAAPGTDPDSVFFDTL
ncbi:beta strand repeat-containing protein, partial [Zavarzinia sp.]